LFVEQAIFTSAETARGEGYQLVSASGGLSAADARALALWSPSHGALLLEGAAAQSVNFHPLPSGAYCVARARPMGREPSGRRGERLHTHCLVAAPELLARFANNPFALLQAAVAGGALAAAEATPAAPLEPLALVGRARAVNEPLVERVCAELGRERMAALMDAAIQQRPLGVCCRLPAEELFAALLNLLPVERRPEFSFSTGLKYSPRRPFRLIAAPADEAEQERLARQFQVTVLRLDEHPETRERCEVAE
jgi:hypothetical protein